MFIWMVIEMSSIPTLSNVSSKHGRRVMCIEVMVRRKNREFMDSSVDNFSPRHIESTQKSIFVPKHDFGSRGWKEDVRNYIPDKNTTAIELFPPVAHLVLHSKRASFISRMYCSNSWMNDFSPRAVGRTSDQYGYASDGTVNLEEPQDIVNVENRIRAVILSCRY